MQSDKDDKSNVNLDKEKPKKPLENETLQERLDRESKEYKRLIRKIRGM